MEVMRKQTRHLPERECIKLSEEGRTAGRRIRNPWHVVKSCARRAPCSSRTYQPGQKSAIAATSSCRRGVQLIHNQDVAVLTHQEFSSAGSPRASQPSPTAASSQLNAIQIWIVLERRTYVHHNDNQGETPEADEL